MLSFKDYLVEAQFSDDDFARLLTVFERRLPALLGSKIYRYGGSGHVIKAGSNSEIVYLFGDRAFGVIYKGGHVLGIEVWKHFADAGASFFIDVGTLNAGTLIKSIAKVAALIKKPTAGQYDIDQVNEAVHLDEMAKRINDDTFYQMLVKKYGEKTAQSVTWAQIKTIADDNDVLIPAYIRSQKIGRGMWNGKPGAGSGGAAPKQNVQAMSADDKNDDADDKSAAPKKKGPLLYIKVTAQDPDTKRFLSTAESKEAQQLLKQIQGGLNSGGGEDHKPTEKELRDPDTLYGHLAQLVEMACKGSLRSLLIYGGPGTGKCVVGSLNIMVLTKEELLYETHKTQGHSGA